MVLDEPEVLEEFEPSEIVPYRIGFCSNPIGRRIGFTEPCGNRIFSDDRDALEVPKGILCGDCVNKILSPKPVIEIPDKVKNKKYGPGHHVRLSKGPPR